LLEKKKEKKKEIIFLKKKRKNVLKETYIYFFTINYYTKIAF